MAVRVASAFAWVLLSGGLAPAALAEGEGGRTVFRYPDEPGAQAFGARETPDRFQPVASPDYDEAGQASIYDAAYEGQPTANGETYAADGLSAAHPTLPLPSLVQVRSEATGRETVVRVNDRGPLDGDGLIALSARAASLLQLGSTGGDVTLRYLGPAPVVERAELDASAMESAPAAVEPAPSKPTFEPAPRFAPTPQSAAIETQPMPAPATRAPKPAPTSAPAPQTSALVDPYFVQVGAFSDIGNAQRARAALTSGLAVEIRQARVNGADFFRVLVGPVDSRPAAEHLRAQLSARGVIDGWIVAGG